MANVIYNSYKRDVLLGLINHVSDTINIMLVTSGYVPNEQTDEKRSDVTNEVVGAGYTAGGVSLSGKSVTINESTNSAVFDANNVTIPNATITARGAVLYKNRGGAASADNLIMYLDFGSNISSTNGDFVIAFPDTGILDSTSV